jgi:ATP-binding cassette subfamily C (CFTR/MRP) protein 1
LATVLTFVTYSLTGHELNVATIFASMQLFSIIQLPVSQLPMVMTALSDSHVAIVRISKILASEEQPHDLIIDASSPFAVEAHGDFCYETATPPDQLESEARPEKANATVVSHDTKTSEESSSKESTGTEANSHNGPTEKQREPFQLKDIDLQIPRGSFVVVYGRIGSGKSALLEGLLGEMRQTRGHVVFGGSVGLVTQTPWIQSTSLKDNILFGNATDPPRLDEVIRACALDKDLEQLSYGVDTEIGGESFY